MTEVASVSRVTMPGGDGNELVGDLWGAWAASAVLLHGGGQTRSAWGRAGERLAAEGIANLALDLRGHGESAWDPHGRYAFPDHARDLGAVLDTLSSPTILIGASLGGVASLKASLSTPERIRAVVLVDITPSMQMAGVDRIVGFMGANPTGFETLDEARAAIQRYQPHRKRASSDEGLKRNLRWSDETGRWTWHWDPRTLNFATPDWYIKQERDMAGGVVALDALGTPTILVRGAQSDVILESDVRKFLDLGVHTRHVEVPGARHMVAGDENEVFMATILEALRDVRVL